MALEAVVESGRAEWCKQCPGSVCRFWQKYYDVPIEGKVYRLMIPGCNREISHTLYAAYDLEKVCGRCIVRQEHLGFYIDIAWHVEPVMRSGRWHYWVLRDIIRAARNHMGYPICVECGKRIKFKSAAQQLHRGGPFFCTPVRSWNHEEWDEVADACRISFNLRCYQKRLEQRRQLKCISKAKKLLKQTRQLLSNPSALESLRRESEPGISSPDS